MNLIECSTLSSAYEFVPPGVETLGSCSYGPSAHAVVKSISNKLVKSTDDPRAGSFFVQRISLATQRDNTASFYGILLEGLNFLDSF